MVLVDEAYYEVCKETMIDSVNRYENLVVLRSFSKGPGLAGLRIGFLASSNKNIDVLLKAGSPYSVSSLSSIAAAASLDDKEYIENYVTEILKTKAFTIEEFEKLEIKTYPSAAGFFMAQFGKKASWITEKLKEKNILVRDRSNYPMLDGCLRIGIGTQEQMQEFLAALKIILKEANNEQNSKIRA
jgi:histidinol-phosphate aminotransferase